MTPQTIRFKNIQFGNLAYNTNNPNPEITQKFEWSLSIQRVLEPTENEKAFAIIFMLSLQNDNFKLTLKAVAHFEADIAIEEDFLQSTFIRQNAPAIAYPFVRTFISNFTLNSGYNPIVLPSFNFLKFDEEEEAKKNTKS